MSQLQLQKNRQDGGRFPCRSNRVIRSVRRSRKRPNNHRSPMTRSWNDATPDETEFCLCMSPASKNVKLLLSQGNQLAILFAAESRISNRLVLVPTLGKKEFRSAGQALIEKQSHFRVAARLIRASSRAAMASARVTLGKSSRNSLRLRSCSR